MIEFEAVQYYNDSEKTLNDNAKKIVECIQIAAEKVRAVTSYEQSDTVHEEQNLVNDMMTDRRLA